MRHFLVVILLLLSVAASAQFNDTTHYHLNLAATGSINQALGNNTYLLNNALNFAIKEKDFVLNSANTYVYGKDNNALTNNDYSSTLNFNLYKTFPHFFYWGLVNYNTSYSLKIFNQVLAGGGLAYNIVDKKNFTINFSDGVLYDQSSLVTNSDYHTWRNSFRFQVYLNVKDILTFETSDFIQNSFSNKSDYILRTTTTLGLKIRKWLSFTTTYTYNQMHITQADNLIFTYGVTIDKYF